MNALRIASLTAALAVTTSACSGYVADTSIAPGDRVRITAPSMNLDKGVGTVAALETDTLVVHVGERAAALQVPLADMTKLEVHRGQKYKTGTGALIGTGVGAAAGVGLALATCSVDGCQLDTADATGLAAIVYGALGALMGGVTGAIIGSTIKVDRWETVPLNNIRVGPSPLTPGGVAVSAAFPLRL